MYKSVVLLLLLTVATTMAPADAVAGPGSGKGNITGSGSLYSQSVPVNTSHKWYVRLITTEPFSNGVIHFEIPADWTPPQDASTTAAGRVQLNASRPELFDLINPRITAINDRTVEVRVDTIPFDEGVILVYGDDSGGAAPSALAKSPPTPRNSTFRIYTHPTDTLGVPVEITESGGSPSIVVTPDVPVELVISPHDATVDAGVAVTYTVVMRDAYGNRAWVDAATSFDLVASEGLFYDSYPGPAITNVVVPAFVDSFVFDYKSDVASIDFPHTINVSNAGLSLSEATTITVNPLPEIKQIAFTSGPYSFSAVSEGGPYTVETQDSLGNALPVTANQQINLSSSTAGNGSFSTQSGDNFTPVVFVTIPNGQSSVTFYYRDTAKGSPTISVAPAGQSWTAGTQMQTVSPGPPARFDISPADAIVDAGVFTQYTATVVDLHDNVTPLTEGKTVLLQPPVGDFYDPGDHGTIKNSFDMALGDTAFVADHHSETAGDGFVVMLTDDFRLFGATNLTVDAGLPDAGASTVDATTNITASGIDSSVVTVTVRDQYGNPIPDETVTITASGDATAINPGTVTDVNGEWTGYVTNTTAEPVTVSALPITDTAQILFVPGGVDPDNSLIAADSPVTADGAAVSIINVVARDAQNNPIPNATVTLSSEPPGSGAILTQPPALTDALGLASGTLTSTAAGDRVVKAVINGTAVADSFTVTFVPGPISTTVSTVEATSPVVANGIASSTVTVTVTDAQGNPITGEDVVLIAIGASIVQPTLPTDAAGRAQGLLTSTTAGPVTVSATAGGFALADNAAVTFIAGVVDPDSSLIAADPVSLMANGTTASTITVTARDANGNPVAGQSVTLSVAPGGSNVVLNQPGGVTAPNGEITGTLLSTETGDQVVKATIGATAVNDSATVAFAPGPVDYFVWSIAPLTGTAGTPKSITLTAYDAQDNLKTDYQGTVTLTTNGAGTITWGPGSGAGLINGNQYTFATADSGSATIAVTNTRMETFRLTAADGIATGLSDDIAIDHATAASIQLVEGDGQAATVFTDVVTSPRIRVTDTYGNLVNAEPVTFSLIEAQDFGSIDVDAGGGGPVDSTGTTNASGELACDRWTLGQKVGTNRVRAVIGAGSVDFDASSTPGQGANILIEPLSQNVTISSNPSVKATLRDAYDNVVPGERVDIRIKPSANGTLSNDAGAPTSPTSPTSRWGNTDASGEIRVVYDAPATAALSDNVDAFSATVGEGSVTDAVYTTVTSGATNLRITFVGADSARAGVSFEMLVEAVDTPGNRDPGINSTVNITPEALSSLTFSLDAGFSSTVTQFDLASGQQTVYGRGGPVGDWDITMSTGGLGDAVDPVKIIDSGAIDSYFVSTVASVTAGTNFDVTIEARDVYGNRVMSAGKAVDLMAVDALTPTTELPGLLVPQITLINGRFKVTQQYPTAVDMLVRARDGSSNEGFSAPVSVTTSAAYQIVYVAGDTTNVVAGTSRDLIAEVRDQFDNPVAGAQVTCVTTTGGGTLPSQPVTTGPNGRVAVTFTTGPVVADNGVKATILDGSPESRERINFLVTTIAGPIDTLIVVADRTAMNAGESVTLDIAALDESGNLVELDNTTLIDFIPGGAAVVADPTGQLTGGTFTTTVSDTLVESFAVVVQVQGSGPIGVSPLISVSNAAAYAITQVTPDENGITVGDTRVLAVDVRDQYGNAVPNEFVRYSLLPAGGPDGTARLSNNGIAQTNASGRATDSLYTAVTAGDNVVDATIGAGPPPPRLGVTFNMTTVADAIDYYTVDLDASQQTAGVATTVTVRAYDASDNLVVGDSATPVQLRLDPGDGASWGDPLPITLSAGILQTTLILDSVQTVNVRAETDGFPSTTGLSGTLTVVPDVPAGIVTLTPTKTTITANGVSTTTITSDVITDQFGNQIPQGALINVSTTEGDILSGSPLALRADGTVVFVLRSSATPAAATVDLFSATGTANGATNIVFAPVPSIVTAIEPSPNSVIVGQDTFFSVPVANTSPTGVILSTATRFEFTDESVTYSAALAGQQTIAGSSVDTLVFTTATVPANIKPARYQPFVQFEGADEFGSSYSMTDLLPVQSLLVSSIKITGISARNIGSTISLGATDTLFITISNPTPDTVRIQTALPKFIPVTGGPKNYPVITQLNTPFDIPGDQSGIAQVAVTVGAGSATGFDQIDASVTGTVGGNPVSDFSLAPYPLPQWELVTARDVRYAAGTLGPATVSKGKTYAMSVRLRNDGAATVSIDTAGTTLSFTDGTETYTANLASAVAIPGGGSQLLEFKSRAIPLGMTPGLDRNVTVTVSGIENGLPFVDVLQTSSEGDGVNVVESASIVVVDGTLSPVTVSKGTDVQFTVQVRNIGGATVELDPDSTRFRFSGGEYEAFLDDNGTTTLTPGFHTLTFLRETVAGTFTPGTYTPAIDFDGTENGLPFSQTRDFNVTNQVTVQDAPDISITSTRPSQGTFTSDQARPIDVWMTVENNGGSTVRLDSARVRFILGASDRTSEFDITNPTQFFTGGANLAGGATDSLHFVVTDEIANAMNDGVMTIEGQLWVTDENTPVTQIFTNTDLGGKGSLLVQTPAFLVIESITPTQDPVTVGQTSPMFEAGMVVTNQGQSDARIKLTNDSTLVTFSPGDGWLADPPALTGGGDLLAGGETRTVVVNVTRAGNTAGTILLGGDVEAEELNSGDAVAVSGSGVGTIEVENAASLALSNVRVTRPTVTSGADVPWEILVNVRNAGQATMDLTFPASVQITPDDAILSTFNLPLALEDGRTSLGAGESGEYRIRVTQTGTFTGFGAKQVIVRLNGVDTNTGLAVPQGTANGSVTVQEPANPQYVGGTIDPPVVSKGATESFVLSVENPLVSRATMRINRNQTRLRFGNSLFDAGLDVTSPDSIPGGQTRQLKFESTEVKSQIDSAGVVTVELHWEENGAYSSRTLPLDDGDLVVQNAGQLQIVSITTSQPDITQNQARNWFVNMVVRNNGEADVLLTFDPDSTKFQFEPLTGLPVTGEYGAITYESGDPLIPGGSGAERTYSYRVANGGASPGPIKITATVTGTDQTSSLRVFDTTIDGGSGGFTLQTPAALEILAIVPSQATATAGQDRDYFVDVVVKNSGQSTADLNLPGGASLAFNFDTGWTRTSPTVLVLSGSTILGGGETDTVKFNVDVTGSTAQPTLIGTTLQGTEINSNDPVSVTVNPGAPLSGTIDVQNPAVLLVSNARVSQPSVTENSIKDWIIWAPVANTGQADATLIADSLSVTIQDNTGSTDIAYPATFVSGGTSLPGNMSTPDTLRIRVRFTGTFSSLGDKAITVRAMAEELNSGDYSAASNNATQIAVESAPNLQYLGGTLTPEFVSQGTTVGFQVTLRNPGANAATVRIEPTTEFTISGQPYTTTLTAADSIPGDGEKILTFNGAPVNVLNNSYPVAVSADYAHNGNAVSNRPIAISNQLTVQTAPNLSIVSITPTQVNVTEAQGQRWFVDVAIQNNGDAAVRIDFDAAATRLIFDHVTAGDDVTSEFEPLGRPTALQGSGTDEIPASGAVDTLRYTVTTTGTTLGNINIEGTVAGNDVNTSDRLDDDTRISGGGGFVNVQAEANLVVTRVSTSRLAVTEGQGTDWKVWVVVENQGGSDLTINVASAAITFDQGADWMWDPAIGSASLAPGAVDSLEFVVTQTSEEEGLRTITASVLSTEDNSGRTIPVGNNVGEILVQTRPDVRFVTTSTELIAPNKAEARVNTDQTFRIAVELFNAGEAGANSVKYRVDGGTAGVIPQPRVLIPSLPGGASVVDTFEVQAESAPAADDIVATVFDGVDDNSQEKIGFVHPDSIDAVSVTVEIPADLVVESVVANVTNVTRQQTVPWYVDVTVRNDGGADLRIDDASGADISFARTLVPQNDYVVLPPDSFLTADRNWVVAGGTTETLRYWITVTGSGLGTIDVTANVASTDINDPESPKPADSGQTSVVVEEPSGVFIESTVVSGLYKQVDNIWYANTTYSFDVSVTVNNTGEALDSVIVSLESNAGIDTVHAGPNMQDIDADGTATYDFRVTAQSTPVSFQRLTATIIHAVSRNTGADIVPGSSQDNTKLLVVQSPAELSIESLDVTWPQNATDGTLSTGQLFDVTTRVSNLGQASVAGAGEVVLRLPVGGGFVFDAGAADSVRALTLDSDISWRLVASTQTGPFDLSSALTVVPKDVNINSRAALADSTLSLTVTVETGGAFTFDDVSIVSPPGATNDTVSTAQTFDVTALITVTSTVSSIQAEILPVGGLQAIGSATVDLGDGDGGQKTANFTLQVPADSTSFASYRVAVRGTDINTSETVTDTSIVRPAMVVLKTSLSLAAEINQPAEAQNDSTVTIGSTFSLGAVVSNAMAAAGIDPATNPRVGLVTPLPSGYTLVRNAANQAFATGDSVLWDIRAPSVPSGPDVFRIRIVSIPDDENTNAPAEVVVIQQSIPIVTEGAAVSMADVTEDLGIDNKVVPGGAEGVDKLAFELMYDVTDPSVNDALVDTVYVTILDKNRQPLSPQGVGGTLAALYIDVGDEQVRVASPQTNPVAVPVTSAPNDAAVIAPDGSVTLVVGMDLKSHPSAGEIGVSIARSRDVIIRDIVSRTRLGVTDAATGQPIDGKFTSAPLVIMSNDFGEYVHNYPNPFQAGAQSTSITYFLTQDGAVSIRIFDLLGNLVYKLEIVAGQAGATEGPQEVDWDGRNMKGEVVRNGVYICVLSAGSNSTKFKIAVAK